jgi:hypothetical protein
MVPLTLARPTACPSGAATAGDAAWVLVARSLDDDVADPSSAPTEPQVRTALASISRALRERGCGPERVLVLIKNTAHAALDARHTPLPPHERDAHVSRLVGWTIDAYYADA